MEPHKLRRVKSELKELVNITLQVKDDEEKDYEEEEEEEGEEEEEEADKEKEEEIQADYSKRYEDRSKICPDKSSFHYEIQIKQIY
ncbi:hypothetical protein M8J77_009674 [Diaphorina citri]|nr:hypothetical protein M8J77_009674 [Diaphorina citri]